MSLVEAAFHNKRLKISTSPFFLLSLSRSPPLSFTSISSPFLIFPSSPSLPAPSLPSFLIPFEHCKLIQWVRAHPSAKRTLLYFGVKSTHCVTYNTNLYSSKNSKTQKIIFHALNPLAYATDQHHCK